MVWFEPLKVDELKEKKSSLQGVIIYLGKHYNNDALFISLCLVKSADTDKKILSVTDMSTFIDMKHNRVGCVTEWGVSQSGVCHWVGWVTSPHIDIIDQVYKSLNN